MDNCEMIRPSGRSLHPKHIPVFQALFPEVIHNFAGHFTWYTEATEGPPTEEPFLIL